MADNEVGVGCGVLADDALTRLLESEKTTGIMKRQRSTQKKELHHHMVGKGFQSIHQLLARLGYPRSEILKARYRRGNARHITSQVFVQKCEDKCQEHVSGNDKIKRLDYQLRWLIAPFRCSFDAMVFNE